MAEAGSMTSSRTREGSSYSSQWNRFVTWSEASERNSLPSSPEDIAAHLEDRSVKGARPSTLPEATRTPDSTYQSIEASPGASWTS